MVRGKNPFEVICADRIPADGLFAAKDVQILWNDDARGKVIDVTVAFVPADVSGSVVSSFTAWQRQFDCTNGNCLANWMEHPRSNPASLFGEWLLLDGFIDDGEMIRAVRELAKIRECQWAREMLLALGERQ